MVKAMAAVAVRLPDVPVTVTGGGARGGVSAGQEGQGAGGGGDGRAERCGYTVGQSGDDQVSPYR